MNLFTQNFFSFFSVPIGVPGATSGSMFTPIPVEITAYDPEVTGLDLLHKTKFAKMRQVEPIPDLARVSEGTAKLEHMLDAVIAYVEEVLSGKETPNNSVGRKLLDLVYSVPKMTPDEFEKMINSNMKVCQIDSLSQKEYLPMKRIFLSFFLGSFDGNLPDAID